MSISSGAEGDLDEGIIEAQKYVHPIIHTVREPMLVLDKDFKIISATNNFYSTFTDGAQRLEGKFIRAVAMSQLGSSEFLQFLNEFVGDPVVTATTELFIYRKPYGVAKVAVNAGKLYWKDEQHSLIMLSFEVISERFRESAGTAEYLKDLNNILAHAPAMICSVRGPQHIFVLANKNYLKLVGDRDIIGKPVREVLPEIENQGFFELLDKVYSSGEPFVGKELRIIFKDDQNPSFLNFVYQPTRDTEGKVDGIFVHAVDVTEQVLIRKKIEESERELRKLIDTVPAIIWITDPQGKSTYLNQRWYEYSGLMVQESDYKGWLQSVHPEDREGAESLFRESHSTMKPYRITYRLRRKNGDYRWVIDRARPKFHENGEFEGMVGTVVDVHEDKIREQLVKEKEHRIRSIVEEATIPTAVYAGRDMKIELANDAMIQLWGKDRSVVGKCLHQALPELEGQPFHKLLQDVYTTGTTYWGKEDKVALMVDNELRLGYFNFTYKPLRNEQGEITGILNMAVDVTEMVESKMLLKESELYFRQMADLMPDKVTNTDPEGNFIYFNQNWTDYTGLSREELQLNGWTRLIHPDEKSSYEANWKQSLESGVRFEMEARCLNRHGKYRWHLSRAEAVKDENGTIKMWIGTHTEIHRIKEEEKRKEDFLKMVSHELKTPITSIKGYVQLLLSLLKPGRELPVSSLPLEPSLQRIDYQVSRLTRLISEMLDLTRLEENKLELQKKVFSMNDLVRETVQDIKYTNTQHEIEIIENFSCKVFADKDRIGQVIINFIINAIKYSPECRNIQVELWKTEEDGVAVSVRDKGIGIDKKYHKNIFKRFYRVGGKSKETYSGFGIGLYLASEIIQRHQGTISVTSKKGHGSVFTFSLAVAQDNNTIKNEQ